MAEKDKISATEFSPVRANPIKTGGKIRVPKVAELVADTIRNRILSGELKEGDSLPPEAQLLEAFETVSYTHLTLPTILLV